MKTFEGTIWYVDFEEGKDRNSGKSPNKAFRTLKKALKVLDRQRGRLQIIRSVIKNFFYFQLIT